MPDNTNKKPCVWFLSNTMDFLDLLNNT
jgi:hypothetical protein